MGLEGAAPSRGTVGRVHQRGRVVRIGIALVRVREGGLVVREHFPLADGADATVLRQPGIDALAVVD